ncbi:UNVERIFIED_CONTAM: hypothetical protein GTU68_020360, partial [Idotea baltica]|nr:hypothetical protein [Idotea baltica]
ILITGVSRGLGLALCNEFARQGHTLAGCARTEVLVNNLSGSLGSQHHFTALDISDDAAVHSWIARLASEWGVPDLVINNAAVITENAPLWDVPLDEFKNLVDINITAVFSVTRHILPLMIARGSGVIANLSSGWGRSVSADVAAYCTTKWAVEGMTQALALDLPEGLAAVPVNPGVINTELLHSCFGESANDAQTTTQWVQKAAPLFLGLGSKDNGQQRSV